MKEVHKINGEEIICIEEDIHLPLVKNHICEQETKTQLRWLSQSVCATIRNYAVKECLPQSSMLTNERLTKFKIKEHK